MPSTEAGGVGGWEEEILRARRLHSVDTIWRQDQALVQHQDETRLGVHLAMCSPRRLDTCSSSRWAGVVTGALKLNLPWGTFERATTSKGAISAGLVKLFEKKPRRVTEDAGSGSAQNRCDSLSDAISSVSGTVGQRDDGRWRVCTDTWTKSCC